MEGPILVTGAGRGLGRVCALALDGRGHEVIAGVRSPEAGERLVAEASGRLRTVELDVTDRGQIAAAAAALPVLGGLLNNAGVAVPGVVEALPVDELRRQLEVNVVGQVAVTQAMLPALRAGRGRVVFTSSVSGRVSAPFLGAYAASKFAIEGLADALRAELAPWGIHVALIEPGSMATDMWADAEHALDGAIDRMTAQQVELYRPLLDGMRKLTRQIQRRAAPPEKVGRAAVHALTARRPRTRYLVGADARAQVAMRALLPDRALDRVLRLAAR